MFTRWTPCFTQHLEVTDAAEPAVPGSNVNPAVGTRILIADDSSEVRRIVRRALEADSFSVEEAADGACLMRAVRDDPPALVLLDLSMPGMSGLESLSQIRRLGSLPVIVLSGQSEESGRVLAFELGADDYVVKPFLPRELPARIRSVLRRTANSEAVAPIVFGPLVIRLPEREVLLDGTLVALTPLEFDLLAKLVSEPRRVFSRDVLLREVWGSSLDWQDPATVTEHVRRLRSKLEADPKEPKWIHSVRGIGYRFEPHAGPAGSV